MFNRKQYTESMRKECGIIKYLASRISPEKYSYRPSESQRTTEELLRYLTVSAWVPAQFIVTENWDHGPIAAAKSESLDLKDFGQAMDDQCDQIEGVLSSFNDEQLSTGKTKMPWGEDCTVGEAFINMTLKCFVAYRMQLFLYAKASGLTEMGPSDCWVGVSSEV